LRRPTFRFSILAIVSLMKIVDLVGAKDLRVWKIKDVLSAGWSNGFSSKRRIGCFGEWYHGSIFTRHT